MTTSGQRSWGSRHYDIRVARPWKNIQALDQHYENLQRELRRTFDTLLITVAPGPNTNTNMFVSTPA